MTTPETDEGKVIGFTFPSSCPISVPGVEPFPVPRFHFPRYAGEGSGPPRSGGFLLGSVTGAGAGLIGLIGGGD